jgi:hypothetical protein
MHQALGDDTAALRTHACTQTDSQARAWTLRRERRATSELNPIAGHRDGVGIWQTNQPDGGACKDTTADMK